uniref:Uncharacterized protein n=1 Tax=Rhizophora mucronata TaxID=61149 RepID=A0A2P2JDY0_RHIMU
MPLPSTSFSCLPFQSSFFCSAPDTFWKMNQNLSSLPNPNRRLRLILWRCADFLSFFLSRDIAASP